MYLKRLEIQGFKTFATKTIFEFRPGVSAIVGPNGSGKSNVVDAMRWVLGEQSYSTLRSRKAEDLIFGGGPRRAPAGFAEVSLTIDNSDRTLPLAFDTVTITRRSTRSGEHEYFINKAKVRLRDIQEATASLGGSYTIINQGLVDNVLDLRPEERRRLFEDAADISVHEQRRNDAMRRLRETDTNVRRCDDVIGELEPRLRSLRRQANAAKQYRDIRHELDAAQILLLRLQHHQANAQIDLARQSDQVAQHHVATVTTLLQDGNSHISAIRQQIRTLREEISTVYADGSRLHSRAESLQRAIAVADERAKALTARTTEFTQSQAEATAQHRTLQTQVAELLTTRTSQQRTRDDIDASLRAIDATRASYNEQRRALRQAVDSAQRTEATTQAAIRERQRQVERLDELLANLSQSHQTEQQLVSTAEASLVNQRTAWQQATDAVSQHETLLNSAQTTITTSRQQIETLRKERAAHEEALTAARRALNQLDSRYQALLQIQRSHGGVVQGVKAALEWAERSNKSFALVSSIISAPTAIELAVETALGARLQHIVTTNWDDAEAAIAALKKDGQGRATFLPLDTIRSGGDNRAPTSGDGVIGVAASLVQSEARYAKVVDYLLGRTLIVADLVVARREISRIGGGWQIVTVSGEQVSSGGSLTGGSHVRDGGTLRRERDVRELPGEIATAKAEVDRLAGLTDRSNSQLQQYELTLRQHEQQRQVVQGQLQTLQQQREVAQRAVNKAESDVALVNQKASNAGDRQRDSSSQRTQLTQELLDLAVQQQLQRSALDQAFKDEQTLIEQSYADEDRRTAAQQQLTDAEGQLRATMATIHASEQRLANLDATLLQRHARTAELDRERAALDAETAAQQAELHEVQAQIAAIQTELAPREAQLRTAEADLPNLESQEQAFSQQLRDAEAEASRTALHLQRASDRVEVLIERAQSEGYDLAVIITSNEPINGDEASLNQQLNALRAQLQRLGPVNPLALEEFEEANERYTFLTAQVGDLRTAAGSLTELIAELDATMRTNFEKTFGAVAREFALTFQIMFGGGSATLELVKQGDGGALADIGIEINARPPGKRQQNLALLSGGERSLTATALLFAILKVKPTPFCVLDEVDAALDEANVARFRAALDDLRTTSQFVIVTHNRGTIEIADSIYGVSMGDDSASRVLSLRLDELVKEHPHLK